MTDKTPNDTSWIERLSAAAEKGDDEAIQEIRDAADDLLIRGSRTTREVVNGLLPDAEVFDGVGDMLYGVISQQILSTLRFANDTQSRIDDIVQSGGHLAGLKPAKLEAVVGEPCVMMTEVRNPTGFAVPLSLPEALPVHLEHRGMIAGRSADVVDQTALYLSSGGRRRPLGEVARRDEDVEAWGAVEAEVNAAEEGFVPLAASDHARVALSLRFARTGIYRVHLARSFASAGAHLAGLIVSPLYVDVVVTQGRSADDGDGT